MLYTENIGLQDCSRFLQIGSHFTTVLLMLMLNWLVEPSSLSSSDTDYQRLTEEL